MQFNQFYTYTAAKYCLAFTVFDFNIRMHSPRIKEYIKNLSRKKMIDFVFSSYSCSSFWTKKDYYQALTLSVLEKLKNLIFEIPVNPQILNINN